MLPWQAVSYMKITMSFLLEEKPWSLCISKIYPSGGATESKQLLDHSCDF